VHPDFGYKGHFHRLYLAQGQISRMELGHAAWKPSIGGRSHVVEVPAELKAFVPTYAA